MNIAVVSLRIGEQYKEATKYAARTKADYCSKHGYTWIELDSSLDPTRTPHWSKLLLILQHLPNYDFVVWMDADIYITNPSVTLQDIIEKNQNGRDIMIGSDWKMINTGMMFTRNTEWSKLFLLAVFDNSGFEDLGNWEQDSVLDLYNKNWNGARDHVQVAEPTKFNSYWFNWSSDHFAIHAAGVRSDSIGIWMLNWCPIRQDGESDQSFQRRMRWLTPGTDDNYEQHQRRLR